jgi:GrpB-like predicted nucleotidyltransferase (UPF0157 family)
MPECSREPVVVMPYDPEWGRAFEALRRVLLQAVGEIVVGVEHVGSTSVPGLAAKPIIDVDAVIPSRKVLPIAVHRLAALGYRHEGDLGVSGREAFARADDVPRDGSGRIWLSHHLYVCATDSPELRRHLAFRDWLRTNAGAADRYGSLKLRLAAAYRFDRDRYTAAKTAFIDAVLREAIGEPQ